MPAAAGSFEGFDPAALAFLRGLAANSAKPWFEANRARYEQSVKQPVAVLISALADMAAAGLPLLRFGWAAIDEVAQPGPAAGPVSRPARSRRG